MEEEEAIKQLMTIDGMGNAKAKLLYDAGFETIEDVKKADTEEIAGVKGIGIFLLWIAASIACLRSSVFTRLGSFGESSTLP